TLPSEAKAEHDIRASNSLGPELIAAAAALKAWLHPVDMKHEITPLRQKRTPGTTDWIINKAKDRLHQSPQDKKIFWLLGAAGVGKSVIAASLYHKLQQEGKKVVSFFCKHDDAYRSSPEHVIRTIAYQLACLDSSIQSGLMQAHKSNVDLFKKASVGHL